MIVDEEEEELEEVEMSEGLSDQEEYMEYSIVQHEVMCVLVNASYHSYTIHVKVLRKKFCGFMKTS